MSDHLLNIYKRRNELKSAICKTYCAIEDKLSHKQYVQLFTVFPMSYIERLRKLSGLTKNKKLLSEAEVAVALIENMQRELAIVLNEIAQVHNANN